MLTNDQTSKNLITHDGLTEDTFDLFQFRKDLESKKDTCWPLSEELTLLDQLSLFELGRFLLMNKGLNGYWTSYIIVHGPKKENLNPLEKWLLHCAPSIKATQERFKIFQKTLQDHLRSDMRIASIPCGVMDDLLTLNYDKAKNTHLTGIDLDPQSLKLAKGNAEKHRFASVSFLQKNAWNLNIQSEYDIITSNGLNIYEPNDTKVVSLYKQFHKALKSDGILITSFLTPPPALSKESTWKNVNPEDVLKQKAIFSDIIGVTWQIFRTESKTREQLESAGFQILDVVYDVQGIFPTIVCRKKSFS